MCRPLFVKQLVNWSDQVLGLTVSEYSLPSGALKVMTSPVRFCSKLKCGNIFIACSTISESFIMRRSASAKSLASVPNTAMTLLLGLLYADALLPVLLYSIL